MANSRRFDIDGKILVDMPPGWKQSCVGDEVDFSRKPRNCEITSDTEVPFMPMDLLPDSGLYATRWIPRKGKELSSGVFFNDGDILLAKITPCLQNGKQGIARGIPGGWGFATTEVYAIRPRSLNTEFLALYFRDQDVRKWLADKLQGATGRQRLPKEALTSLGVPVPPPDEQRAIIHVLRTVQRAKEATGNVLAAARQLKRSLMRHLFTYGPVPFDEVENVELRQSDIGTKPEQWQEEELANITDIVYGVQAAVAHNTDPKIGIPILTNINITIDGTCDLGTLRYYDLPEQRRDKLILKKGDVLFNWRSGSEDHVGKTAMFSHEGDFTFSSFILRFRSKGRIENEYLYYCLSSLKADGFFAHYRAQSSVNSVFNASAAAKVPIAFPGKKERAAIVMALQAIDRKLAAETNRYKSLEALVDSLIHNLMTGQVHVHELGLSIPAEVS